MYSIDKQFSAFLKYLADRAKYGFNKKLSTSAGIPEQYISKLIKGIKAGSEETRRKIADALGYDYDQFLRYGQAILDGRNPDEVEAEDMLKFTDDNLRDRGFIAVPFSDNMRLAAGGGGTIEVTEDAASSPVVIYGGALPRGTNLHHLQAFRVGGDSMEPVIAQGGLVVADTSDRDPDRLKEGRIYVLCWDLQDQECAVKYLSWAERGKAVLITSPSNDLYKPIVKPVKEIRLIGRVIWSWRDHK